MGRCVMGLFDKIYEKYEQDLRLKIVKNATATTMIDAQVDGIYRVVDKYYDVLLHINSRSSASKKSEKEILQKRKQTYLNRFLSSVIPKSYVIGLMYDIKDDKGNDAYSVYDYFLCDKKPSEFGMFDTIKVIKISGNNLGEAFELIVTKQLLKLNYYFEVEIREGDFYYGDSEYKVYIPERCNTIGKLKDYADSENERRKKAYEKRCQIINQKL